MNDTDDRHGFVWQLGLKHVAKAHPDGHPKTKTAAIVVLALVALVLLWLPNMTRHSAAPVTTAKVQPLPTAVPPIQVHVTGASGAVCILPTGKAKAPVELVKVP